MEISKLSRPIGKVDIQIVRNGEVIQQDITDNLVVNRGLETLVHLLGAGEAGDYGKVTHLRVGTGLASPASGNTNLGTVVLTKAIGSVVYPAPNQVRWTWTLSTAEANGSAISELGLFCFRTPNYHMFSRVLRASPINKTADISINGVWTVTF